MNDWEWGFFLNSSLITTIRKASKGTTQQKKLYSHILKDVKNKDDK